MVRQRRLSFDVFRPGHRGQTGHVLQNARPLPVQSQSTLHQIQYHKRIDVHQVRDYTECLSAIKSHLKKKIEINKFKNLINFKNVYYSSSASIGQA